MHHLIRFILSSGPFLLVSAVAVAQTPQNGVDEHGAQLPERMLTLGDAMARSLRNNPQLAAVSYQQQAEEARSDASMDGTPNPEISVSAEDFLGNGEARGVNGMQVTTAISQEVELGGKLATRRKVRASTSELAKMKTGLTRKYILSEVAMAYLDVLAQQERLSHAQEMVRLSQKTVETIATQVEAGRSTGMEQDKATVELSLARLRESEAWRELASAKVRLAATCGSDTVFFDNVAGTLNAVSTLPDLDDILMKIPSHPELLAAAAQIRQQQALADAAHANRVPNVTFELGFRWNNGSDNGSLVAGVGMPIPLLDRNLGNIEGARREVSKASSVADAQKIMLTKDITIAYQTLEYELHRLQTLQGKIGPSVVATFNAVEEGYRIGRFGYLDLLDAQRTLFEVKNMILNAQVQYQFARILLQRSAGESVSDALFTRAKKEPPKTSNTRETP